MYHSYFGKLGQLRFPKPEDYYRFPRLSRSC